MNKHEELIKWLQDIQISAIENKEDAIEYGEFGIIDVLQAEEELIDLTISKIRELYESNEMYEEDFNRMDKYYLDED